MYNLDRDYQSRIVNKWGKILDARNDIPNDNVRVSTAMILENTHKDLTRTNKNFSSMLNEASYPAGSQGAAADGTVSNVHGPLGTTYDYGVNDSRIPSIVVPAVRRIFPNLFAHEVVSVQPMSGPVGFAYAIRAQYGENGNGGIGTAGTELGYQTIDNAHTGLSGAVTGGDYWEAFAGSTAGADAGTGAPLGDSEYWGFADGTMPLVQMKIDKGTVTANTRKLGATFTLEMAEDMENMHGIGMAEEMIDIVSYEIKAEMDREILGKMVAAAIGGSKTSVWSPVSADGRHQLERISTLYTHILDKRNDIALATRRGPGNFCVASTKVCALIERMGHFGGPDKAVAQAVVNSGNIGVSRAGVLPNGMAVYRDINAGGNYALIGYKGAAVNDSGIVFCPYIPLQLSETVRDSDLNPVMAARTRYGVLNNLFGTENYYHFMKIDDLTDVALAADGGRVFMA